ncbi:hypothetical protein DTO063F5_7094 [Paecilomyces variotii]|nr:hypothetical protein DTO063F5_7094 [Paecilomyces variotii]
MGILLELESKLSPCWFPPVQELKLHLSPLLGLTRGGVSDSSIATRKKKYLPSTHLSRWRLSLHQGSSDQRRAQ